MLKPIVAVTMGDPAGIGPEVVLKAVGHPEVRNVCRAVVIGDLGILERTRRGKNGRPDLIPWRKGQGVAASGAGIPVHRLSALSPAESRPGSPSATGGEAAYRYIKAAVDLVMSEGADAIATAPISKKALWLAGYRYPGHTEILAEMTRTKECRMMLVGAGLKIVLATVHLPLARVSRELTRARIRVTIELAHRALREQFGVPRPRLAVAAFNPHAGEEEIFGHEEKRVILPAVKEARRRGIEVQGPLPADSLFRASVRANYDALVCMYHDQGLIPLKLVDFSGGVTVTLGLPIIRTSVDHGTAYDIAGMNRADPSSMREAIVLAANLARQKQRRRRR